MKKGGEEFTINVFGSEQKHTLPNDMTIEEFKSFVLTLTDNEVFDLGLMISNKSTLKHLKKQIFDWNKQFSPSSSDVIEVRKRENINDNKFTLYFINKSDKNKVVTIENNKSKDKLRHILQDLEKKLGKPEDRDAFHLMFADEVTDVQSYLNKEQEYIDLTNVKFDKKKDVTLGELGINKFSTMTVEKKEAIPVEAQALDDIFVHHQDYMNLPGAVDGILSINFDTD